MIIIITDTGRTSISSRPIVIVTIIITTITTTAVITAADRGYS
jgi:hypothetical protein